MENGFAPARTFGFYLKRNERMLRDMGTDL